MSRFLCFLFACLFSVCGCGSSFQESYLHTPTPDAARTTTVELRSILAQTAIPGYITNIRGSGFDASGERVYGPANKVKAATVQWTFVPLETKSFLFEFLGANGQVLGNATVAVRLIPSEIYIVDGLAVNFDPNPIPESGSDLRLLANQNYQFNTDTGVVSPPIGGSSNPPGWNSETKEFELETFTLETGAVLNVSGNTTLKVKTQGDTTLNGTLSFTGADGEDGADTEITEPAPTAKLAPVAAQTNTAVIIGAAGEDGANGGVSLVSLGQFSGHGTILSRGGNGGTGGNVRNSMSTYLTSLTGGRGGNGGAPGQVTIIDSSGRTVFASVEVETQSGNGGNGGSISIDGDGSYAPEDCVLQGGLGGDATGRNGNGGHGGHVVFSAERVSNAGIAAGGNGGEGDFQGGNGGEVAYAGFNGQNHGTTAGGTGGIGGTYGGRGGDVQFSGEMTTNSRETATGGAGGEGGVRGGDGGDVIFSSSDIFDNLATATGGAGGVGGTVGGNGGKVELAGQRGGYNHYGGQAFGGAGGQGGMQGGDGGDVFFFSNNENYSSAAGGAGGSATAVGGLGGDGGDVVFAPGSYNEPNATSVGGAGGIPSGSAGTVIGP